MIMSIQLTQPCWGSQQIVSTPPQPVWGTNNIQYKAFTDAHTHMWENTITKTTL